MNHSVSCFNSPRRSLGCCIKENKKRCTNQERFTIFDARVS
jgi:hypothetical protein